jgi:CO/xanthine dehydrogenase FAD-binding subunit
MIRRLVMCSSLAEARELVSAEGTSIVAGGTDLVAMYLSGNVSQHTLADIRGVAELSGVSLSAEQATIGSMTVLDRVARLDVPWLGALSDGAANIGSRQTRRRGTLGGNICRASPSGDTLASLLVMDAQCHVAGKEGSRVVPAREFFVGPGKTVLQPGEILEQVTIPLRAGGSAYQRSTVRRGMDLATVGVAVALWDGADSGTSAAIGVIGAAPTPVLAVESSFDAGAEPDLDRFEQQIQDVIRPIDDVRGGAWYRRRLIRPLLEGALARAVERRAAG